MTPVDIDKLKELQRLLSDGEWWQTVTRGPNPTSFTSDMTHVARQAAALIAKAERVDAMEAALQEIADWKLPETGRFWDKDETEPMSYGACFGSNGERDHIRSLARNALSPKESE